MRLGLILLVVCIAGGLGCRRRAAPAPGDPGVQVGAPSSAAPAPTVQPVTLLVAYGSEKKTWLEEQVKTFELGAPKLGSGEPIKVELRAMGSGEAVQAIQSGELKPHVFSPASGAYITVLNHSWLSQAGHTAPLSPAGEPLVLSPVVIAMWKPMAEALGWPEKSLGWSDLVRISSDPRGWGAKGHPEWGPFKFGHTHPEFSNSGLLSVLAEAYAGAKKTRGLTEADLASPAVQKFVTGVEKSIVHYGKSTGFFAEKMLKRGPAYLSAAVLYENLVIESYANGSDAAFPLVAVYPAEGTFWADHPYATLEAPWVGAREREAAQRLLAFLKARPQQERALALGFRPEETSIPVTAPVDAAHGVNPKEPQTLLEVPNAPTLAALLALWREHKKASDVVLVFDKSGSMAGRPLTEAKAGAKAFLDGLGDRDEVSLLFFDDQLYPPIGPFPLAGHRAELAQRIDGAIASGGTSLYEATAAAYADAAGRVQTERDRIHAVVVMTDGKDESSKLDLAALQKKLGVEGGDAPVKVFTIGYGSQPQREVLDKIAETAQGQSVQGSVETIVQVYRDMASFF